MIGKKSIVSLLSIATLASCATQDNAKQTPISNTTPSQQTTTTSPDGTRSIVIKKSYMQPNREENTLNATLVTKNDIIESITTDGATWKPFAQGISEKIVGKSIKGLQVDTISGASLTVTAFNEFIKNM